MTLYNTNNNTGRVLVNGLIVKNPALFSKQNMIEKSFTPRVEESEQTADVVNA